MDECWLELEDGGGERRLELKRGLTRIGGRTADVVLSESLAGELHLWDDPPKLVNIGVDVAALLNGAPFEERPLADGDRIELAGKRLVFRRVARPPVLEELHVETPAPEARPAATGGVESESRVARRVRAGLLAELGLADPSTLGRWQQAVVRREFDPEACARELLRASDVGADDPRLLERSGRLLRDLVMAPMQRGVKSAGRRARGAAKSGAAFLVAQVIVVGIFSLLVLMLMVFVHVKWPDFSFDEFLGALVPGGE